MNIITIPLKKKWGEEIEHKTFFNIDEDLVNYIRLLEDDIDNYNKELLSQGEKIYKAIELLNQDWYSVLRQETINKVKDILQGSDKE